MKTQVTQRRLTEEFKQAAIKKVIGRNHKASEITNRLGISTNSLYTWFKRY